MSSDFVLDSREQSAALAVLQRELIAHLPTKRQNILYRIFNFSAYLMAIVFLFEFLQVSMSIFDIGNQDIESDVLHILFGILGIVTLVLFLLNLTLIRKLYRLARLRRRLRLVYYFKPVFRAQRKATRLKNVITMCITVLGGILILLGGLMVLLSFALWIDGGFLQLDAGEFAVFLSASLVCVTMGLSLAALHFMRRGKERLEVVMRLWKTLSEQSSEPAADAAPVTLSSEDYGLVARLEREHIIASRANSIVAGRKEAGSSGYVCLSSRQMTEAKSKLPEKLLSRVDETVMALLANPLPSSTTRDPQTGHCVVPVPDTELSIQYDVNMDRHLIRLHGLQKRAA